MRTNWLTIIGMVFALPCLAAEPTAVTKRSVTLLDCVQMALEKNLALRISRLGVQVEQQRLSGMYGAYDPNFTMSGQHNFTGSLGTFVQNTLALSASTQDSDSFSTSLQGITPWGFNYTVSANAMESWGVSGGNAFDRYNANIGVVRMSQPLLKNFWIDNARMTIWIQRKQLKISDQTLQKDIMDTVTSVEGAYYDLIFAREDVEVQKKALELVERSLFENKQRVKVGAMAPLDEKQAESQVAASKANLISSQQVLAVRQNALRNIISDDVYNTSVPQLFDPKEDMLAVPMAFNLQDSWSKGLTLRPELISLKIQAEQMDIQLRYYRNQLFPALDLIGSYSQQSGTRDSYGAAFSDLGERRGPNYYWGAEISFPLTRRSARSTLRQGRIEKEQFLLNIKQLEQQIMVTIDNAITFAKSGFEKVDATHQARLFAEAALDAEQKKLENGKSTSFIVLQLQRDLTTARSDEIRALTEYNKSLSALSRAEGSTLQRLKINLEVK
jgi:outer membrane protein TolC